MFKSFVCIICSIIIFMEIFIFNRQTIINKNIENIIKHQYKILNEITMNQYETNKKFKTITNIKGK